eukprot:TRINITY_DN5732_c0_g3_i1.p1 TRINITY_DN5732_c0_g3~~TRINITY_DN5732_c0_g3_i1.p1  ORF type:complete len:494 (+),score=114.43 TRINITY_DN5732_c0_g3_i1:73-1554(+)
MGGACVSKRAVQIHPGTTETTTAVVPGATSTSSAAAPATSSAAIPATSSAATPATSSAAAAPSRPADASAGQGQQGNEALSAAAPPASPSSPTLKGAPERCESGALMTPAVPETPAAGRPKPKKNLIKAVKEGNLVLIDELVKEGSDLEVLGMWDNTPLLAACNYNNSEAALRLINAKANVCARNEHGATPLHYAAVEGSLSVVNALLDAVKTDGGQEQVTKMVNCDAAKVYNRHLDAYGQRVPLASAAESGFSEVAETLLAAGAQVDKADEDGRTALWLACRYSRVAVAKMLFQKQAADTTVKDKDGISVLAAATAGGCNEDLVLALLTHGVGDVNDTTAPLLRDAVKAGKRTVAEALLTHGASVNTKAPVGGATALHAACEKGDEHLISLLIRFNASPSLGDAANMTAFDILRRRGLPDGRIASLLSPPAPSRHADDGGTGSAGCSGAPSDGLSSNGEKNGSSKEPKAVMGSGDLSAQTPNAAAESQSNPV